MIAEKTMATEKVHISGGFWEIRLGTLNDSVIAVKTPMLTTTTDIEKIREVSQEVASLLMSLKCSVQRFCRGVILWNSLSHPNVLKFTGVLGSIDTFNFSTVSEWMTHGTITRYLETMTNNVNRLELVCPVSDFSLCSVLNSVNLATWSGPRSEVHP